MLDLIGMTVIKWPLYVKNIEKLIGRSPTRALDSSHLPVGSAESFILSIGDLKSRDLKNYELKHINLVFLCETDILTFHALITSHKGFSVTIIQNEVNNVIFIFSGTIDVYFELLISMKNMPSSLRLLSNRIFQILENHDFKEIFFNYKKVFMKDKTFILERK